MGQDLQPASEKPEDQHGDAVARLKELLFSDEAQTLKGMSQRIEQVYERAGDDEHLKSSVARVLDGALMEAEKFRHEQVSRAMAPMVVKTVKAEFLNSQDELVEAIYPITGRMVKSYVATAMADLANEINRKLENNSFMLRLRSIMTGRPVAELAISDSQRLNVEEILLIRRGSGELLERWPDTRALSNRDAHLSGILSAINDFAGHAFQEEGGTIRNFAVDDFSMFLRASPSYLLAAKCSGTSAGGIQYIIDDEFLGLLERVQANQVSGDGHTSDLNLLSETKERLDERIKSRFDEITAPMSVSPLRVLGWLLLLGLLAGLGWWGYTSYEAERTRIAANQIIAASGGLKREYVKLDVGYRGRTIAISGLSPSEQVTEKLTRDLEARLAGVKVTNGLFSFPTSNAGAEIERLRIEMEAGATADILRRSLKRTELRLASALQAFPDIERQRSSDADKREIRRARLLIEQSQREIRSYRGAVEAAPLERGALSDLGKPLEALATRLSSVGGIMAGLLGLPGAQAPAPGSEAAGLTATAERAATEADHVAALAVALTVPRAPTVTPRQRVQAWIQNNAIFFSTDDSFRSPGEAAVKIDELAQLIKADDGLIRIVGYTDERGSQSRNDSIAQRRAERVREELVKRGVPATRLLTMGRATGPDLSPDTGENSPNRRVQIEIGFIGEDGR